jgi:hypothetical protein
MLLQITQDEVDKAVVIAKEVNPLAAKFIKRIKNSNGHFETTIETDSPAGDVEVRIELVVAVNG